MAACIFKLNTAWSGDSFYTLLEGMGIKVVNDNLIPLEYVKQVLSDPNTLIDYMFIRVNLKFIE